MLQPFQMPSQKLDVSFHPWCWCCRNSPCPWQVDVTAQGSGACAGANLPVVSSLSLFIHVSLASWAQSQCAEPGLALQSCWSLLWRCFCCGYTCVISFCDYKCLSLEFILPRSGVLAFPSPFNWKLRSHCLNLQKQTRWSYLEKFLCELFFLSIFQNYVVNDQMKMKNRWFGWKYKAQ